MTSETDAEFVERMMKKYYDPRYPDSNRLFDLAICGAEFADRIEQLEAALNNIGMYTYPRVPGEYADECTHEIIIGKQLGLNHECHDCMAAYARAALEERT